MTTPITIFTLLYLAVSFCFVFKTSEFVSAGMTVESLFDFYLGNEHSNFILYHIKRTSLTFVLHSFLPLLYIVGVLVVSEGQGLVWAEGQLFWVAFEVFSLLMPTFAVVAVLSWRLNDWSRHPIVRTLRLFDSNRSWRQIAEDISAEYRRLDKIVIVSSSVTVVVATDNWLIKTSAYTVDVTHQSDSVLILCSTDEHELSRDGPALVQYVNIEVKSTRPGIKPFVIRCNAVDLRDLQDRLRRPVTVLSGITFHKTRVEQFVDIFKEAIKNNPTYVPPAQAEVEMCMGCMLSRPSVKLMKQCSSDCTNCYCRPLWCADCMAKWFASRQEQDRPETWLSSNCTCPVCRSVFCLLDVCPIEESSTPLLPSDLD